VAGVDIENSSKSYEGAVSLIQISVFSGTSMRSYVFDVLNLFQSSAEDQLRDRCFKPFFEDGRILKIFHGAVSLSAKKRQGANGDLGWIQRDFGARCTCIVDSQ